jgi:hypothetical protein
MYAMLLMHIDVVNAKRFYQLVTRLLLPLVYIAGAGQRFTLVWRANVDDGLLFMLFIPEASVGF